MLSTGQGKLVRDSLFERLPYLCGKLVGLQHCVGPGEGPEGEPSRVARLGGAQSGCEVWVKSGLMRQTHLWKTEKKNFALLGDHKKVVILSQDRCSNIFLYIFFEALAFPGGHALV
jgi:hypothetical protein